MKKSLGVCAAAVLTAMGSAPAPASAQAMVPGKGMTAVGFTIEASLPSDDALDSGADIGAQVEHYLTPRDAIRGRISGAWFDISGRPFTGTVHPIALEGNLVHNWERGVWHPYLTAGLGWYHYKFTESKLDSSDDKFGINLGGGAEYFLTRHDALLGELQVRIVPGRTESLLSDYESGYWTLGVGYKKYF